MKMRRHRKIVVSPVDKPLLDAYSWHVSSRGYVRTGYLDSGKVKFIYLHRAIVAAPSGMVVDHINGDKLDNRRENLRVCTHADNCRAHRQLGSRNRSGYLGVHLQDGRWRAMIRVDNRAISLGMYSTAEEAAKARDAATLRYFGPQGRLNFKVC